MAEISLEGVRKRFGDTWALDGLDLDVADEEFLVLLGPSGCGKSTVLRLIAGLDEPTEGRVSIGGRDVTLVEPGERDVAMVFQSYALYPHMSVRRNVEFPLRCRRVPRGERRDRVAEVTAAPLGVASLLDRRPAQLSGGQRQRVALARAMVCRPVAFLMDEPLSNLDAKLRGQTHERLAELHHRLRATIVYVTHDQVEAMTMADRIAVIDRGRVQQTGSPQEVYERPSSVFVAQFLGSPPMSCLPARVVGDAAGGVSLDLGCGNVPVDRQLAARVGDRREVVAGVRPEHIERRADGPLRAPVAGVELLGAERHLVCRVDGAELIVREDARGPAPRPGDVVGLDVRADRWHLFDATTGDRLGP